MVDVMTRIEFGRDDLDNVMTKLSSAQIDGLAFGAIQLDRKGTVLTYNMTESAITGRRPEDVLGRNFFDEIAPCCNKAGFRGVFDAGVARGDLSATFDYTFDYRMNPTQVRVQMKKALVGDTYWVFVKRIDGK